MKMSIRRSRRLSELRFKCVGNRCNPPAVVPPLWLAFVISKLVKPASRNLSLSNAGYAWLELRPNPADKLSPKTRIRFIGEESREAASMDCARKARPGLTNTKKNTLIRVRKIECYR